MEPSPLDPTDAPEDLVALVGARLEVVRSRIASAGGDPARVTVVAVTKGAGLAWVRAALLCGLADLGENYADELLAKAGSLEPLGKAGSLEPRGKAGSLSGGWSEVLPGAADRLGRRPAWHFLGQVQRNKVARLAPVVSLWQGVDRLEEGEAIARAHPGAAVLVEVGAAGLAGRGGVELERASRLVGELSRLGLEVRGAMTIAPPGAGDGAREAFGALGRLVAELGLEEASMGMSDDLELAVQAGSTMIRVGRALFGDREGKDHTLAARSDGTMGAPEEDSPWLRS